LSPNAFLKSTKQTKTLPLRRFKYLFIDNIFILKTVINKYLNRRNGKVFVCFVDFKKAFGDKHVYSNFWIRELEGTFTTKCVIWDLFFTENNNFGFIWINV
jgi:hypothetical protein